LLVLPETSIQESAVSDPLTTTRDEVRLTAEEMITREAILDVIDEREVYLWSYQRDTANAARLDFADAVVCRMRRIKQVDDEFSANRLMRATA
jgi:hypothetical protein